MSRLSPYAFACMLVVAPAWAHAGTIITPVLPTGNGDQVECWALNASTATANVKIQIRDGGGNVEATHMTDLPAGKTESQAIGSPPGLTYCRVSGSGISKVDSRVTHCVLDSNDTPLQCVTVP
jgi:hypothetical protein